MIAGDDQQLQIACAWNRADPAGIVLDLAMYPKWSGSSATSPLLLRLIAMFLALLLTPSQEALRFWESRCSCSSLVHRH